jgi:hypothetical protein
MLDLILGDVDSVTIDVIDLPYDRVSSVDESVSRGLNLLCLPGWPLLIPALRLTFHFPLSPFHTTGRPPQTLQAEHQGR